MEPRKRGFRNGPMTFSRVLSFEKESNRFDLKYISEKVILKSLTTSSSSSLRKKKFYSETILKVCPKLCFKRILG